MGQLIYTTSDGIDIYDNHLVRYFTDDRSKIQYGLAKRFDSYSNRLIVSALLEAKVNPANIIETYTEEEWKHITFDRGDEKFISTTIYPFYGPFTLSEKLGKANRIVKDLPYKKNSKYSYLKLMNMSKEEFQKEVLDGAYGIVRNEVMDYNLSSINGGSTSLNLKVITSLPVGGKFETTFDIFSQARNPDSIVRDYMGRLETLIYSKILNGASQEDVDSNFVLLEKLPYIENQTLSYMKDIFPKGYKDNFIIDMEAKIRNIINTNLIKHYTYSNGATIIFDLPFVFEWQIFTETIFELGKEATKELVIEHAKQWIDVKANTFQYGIMISKGALYTPIYVTGAPLMEISESALRTQIIEHFEEIISRINYKYWDIKTIKDYNCGAKISAVLPIVQELEYLDDKSDQTRHIYRTFIRHSNGLYRAYVLVNNRRLNKGITIASPHIYSKNAILLKEYSEGENPLKYSENYLVSLINDHKNEVIDLVENDITYH